jgi:hypothetical protein
MGAEAKGLTPVGARGGGGVNPLDPVAFSGEGVLPAGITKIVLHSGHLACFPAVSSPVRRSLLHFVQRNSIAIAAAPWIRNDCNLCSILAINAGNVRRQAIFGDFLSQKRLALEKTGDLGKSYRLDKRFRKILFSRRLCLNCSGFITSADWH